MAEYIERDQILGYLDLVVIHARGVAGNDSILKKVTGIVENMRDLVAEAPAADVVPVVHGRWIPIKVPTGIELLGIKEMVVGFIRCSECDMEFDISSEWYSNYCPNCGARMKEGDSDG